MSIILQHSNFQDGLGAFILFGSELVFQPCKANKMFAMEMALRGKQICESVSYYRDVYANKT